MSQRLEGIAVQDSASEKKIRLGEVASALDVAPKLIRNWTSNAEFDLFGQPDRQINKWRQYSYLDVAHLAVAAQAIRYGFTIGSAHDFAGATLVRLLEPLMHPANALASAPGGIIEALCRGKNLYLFKLSDGDTLSFITPLDELPRYNGAAHIDLEMCVGMAFAGLREIGHDAFSSSARKEYSEAEAEELERAFKDFLRVNPKFEAAVTERTNVERQSDFTAPGASAPGQIEDEQA